MLRVDAGKGSPRLGVELGPDATQTLSWAKYSLHVVGEQRFSWSKLCIELRVLMLAAASSSAMLLRMAAMACCDAMSASPSSWPRLKLDETPAIEERCSTKPPMGLLSPRTCSSGVDA